MKILLVEDEKKSTDGVRAILEKAGYRVEVARDGESGLDCMLSDVYDLVLLDIVMPGMSGMEVLKTARREGVTTPVIMLTGVSEIENMVRDGSVLKWKELGENQFYVE